MQLSCAACLALLFVVGGLGQQETSATPGTTGGGRGGRAQPEPIDFNDHPGWTQLFDGQSLNGWDGNSDVWKIADGAIIGEYTTPAGTRNGQTFLIWKGGQPADFELKLEIKLEGLGADSGIQYRGYLLPGQGRGVGGQGQVASPAAQPPTSPQAAQWNLGGYQFDFNFPGNYNGQIAEAGANARGIIAYRGQIVRTEEGKRPRLLSTSGSIEELGGYFKVGDWNQIHLIARGNTLIQMINGHFMAMLIDEDSSKSKAKGLIGLQCAGNGPVRISFRNIWIKNL